MSANGDPAENPISEGEERIEDLKEEKSREKSSLRE